MVPRLLALLVLSFTLLDAAPALKIPPAAQAGPNFNAGIATRAYLATQTPQQKARSDAYFEGGYWLLLWDFLYGAAVSILLLSTGWSARMRDLAERLSRRLATWLYWVQYVVAVSLLSFPLLVYEGFLRERSYGLMNQTFGAWFIDQTKGLALAVIFGGLLIMALFAVVRRLPRTWHLWAAGVVIAFQLLAFLVYPVFIAPLFNTYKPLEDARVRDRILRLARQNGLETSVVWQVDASRQSNRVSANVSGMLGTERITLNDNLLNRCSPEAIEAVMGHEIGHYVLNHVHKFLAWLIIGAVAFFTILRWGLDWSLRRWGTRWGIRGIGDPAVLPLAILILSILFFVSTPALNTLIRVQEYEADLYGLNTARQPDGEAEVDLLLGEYRKLEPAPLEEFLLFDHPSGYTRILAAMRWKAENQ